MSGYAIGRVDGQPMILPVMIPPLAVLSIRFPDLENAVRFQDFLQISDRRGLDHGDYYLNPLVEIDMDGYEPEGPEIPA